MRVRSAGIEIYEQGDQHHGASDKDQFVALLLPRDARHALSKADDASSGLHRIKLDVLDALEHSEGLLGQSGIEERNHELSRRPSDPDLLLNVSRVIALGGQQNDDEVTSADCPDD